MTSRHLSIALATGFTIINTSLWLDYRGVGQKIPKTLPGEALKTNYSFNIAIGEGQMNTEVVVLKDVPTLDFGSGVRLPLLPTTAQHDLADTLRQFMTVADFRYIKTNR